MTLRQQSPGTATGPTLGSTARHARGPALVVAGLVLTALVLALLSGARGGRLDPESFTRGGARAVAELLRQAGVPVQRVETVQDVAAADRTDVTVVVPFPQALAAGELEALAGAAARLVLIGASQDVLDVLRAPVDAGPTVEVERRRPACALPAAQVAGQADLGGTTYVADGVQAAGCYAASGRATVLVVPAQGLVLLGDGAPLTNDRLDERGNAALALGLLGDTNRVLWLVPRPGRELPPGSTPPLSELIPDGVKLGGLWLLVVAAALALWRGRRLGRVVEEPLPVVVRAAETAEGRSRLYRAAGARGAAAEALRAATRDRLAHRVGLPVPAERVALVPLVAQRTGHEPGAVDGLLYGDEPADDAALVRLAGDLRILEQTLNQEVAGP